MDNKKRKLWNVPPNRKIKEKEYFEEDTPSVLKNNIRNIVLNTPYLPGGE